ncbi:MAG: CoA pyrophosphatase, partial [Bacteroidales bacterium]|nr:CoA pyrophosphatase [Bacteroidales bacterium]
MIRLRLADKLPGPVAQYKMAPLVRRDQMKKVSDTGKGIKSSVLILFYPDDGEIFIPFIRRQQYDGVHSGQIAFPGGKYEEHDPDLMHTAIREANEEIGINPDQIEVIGYLTSLYIPPSNYNVLPVVAYSREKPEFEIDKAEVDYLLNFKLSEITDVRSITEKEIPMSDGRIFKTPCYLIRDHIIW